ncbi:hypothetical protein P167DRAFT_579660 [Morchella conica CCBAS932]|uniref:Uncharacterized protein n=1 Tax=Morchella conica CCBAS932 TaxID=1392247 RepID=A0A3N4KMN1_9PEZI|nr:hypothetical protein P167DRAFT_579660 [Morchella conica CCBAS932]
MPLGNRYRTLSIHLISFDDSMNFIHGNLSLPGVHSPEYLLLRLRLDCIPWNYSPYFHRPPFHEVREDEDQEDETTLPDARPSTLTLVIDGSDDDTDSEVNSCVESDFDADSDNDGTATTAPLTAGQADDNQRATAYLPNSGQRLGRVQSYRDHMEENWKPWTPFKDAVEWRLSRFFIEHKLTSTSIDAYFNQGLHKTTKDGRSFQSAYTFLKQLDKMIGSSHNFQYGTVGDGFGRTINLYYRNPVEYSRDLLDQYCYKLYMVYWPESVYNADGYQLYFEMHTADWW